MTIVITVFLAAFGGTITAAALQHFRIMRDSKRIQSESRKPALRPLPTPARLSRVRGIPLGVLLAINQRRIPLADVRQGVQEHV